MTDTDSERGTDRQPKGTGTDRSSGEKQGVEDKISGDRLVTDSAVLDSELPRNLQELLGRTLDEEPVETLGDWVTEVRRYTGGESIGVNELCHSDEETGHWGKMDGETYHFLCFYDAVILSAVADQPVEIRTESPSGTVVKAQAAGTSDLTVTPDEAVFSFGIDETVESPSDGYPLPGDIYAAICPYVRAFPNPEAYERWAKNVPAATIALPLAGATEMAAALVE